MGEIMIAITNGMAANMDEYEAPIFLPQELHFADNAGPRHIFRMNVIPSPPQWGHVSLDILYTLRNLTLPTAAERSEVQRNLLRDAAWPCYAFIQ